MIGPSECRAGRVGTGPPAGSRWARACWRVSFVVGVVVLIIVAGILLVVLKANPANSIVSEVHDWAHSLAGPFNGMFSFHSANTALAVNRGIAAVLYLFVGGLIARRSGSTLSWICAHRLVFCALQKGSPQCRSVRIVPICSTPVLRGTQGPNPQSPRLSNAGPLTANQTARHAWA